MEKNKIIRLIAFGLCLAVFIYSGVSLLGILQEYRQGEELYQTAQQEYTITAPVEPATEPVEESEPIPDFEVDFAQLKQTNPDICGWLWMNDSVINYPVVRGADNERYLDRTYDGTWNSAGSIFMDYRNPVDFSDDNTILYGHNMKNGTMFASLRKFNQADYYQQHKYFYLITEEGMYRYDIVAAFVTDALSNVYSRNFSDIDSKGAWVDMIVRSSGIATEAAVDAHDQFITLSTCVSGNNYRDRHVVIGRLVNENQETKQ